MLGFRALGAALLFLVWLVLTALPASAHATFAGAPGTLPGNTDQVLRMNVPIERDANNSDILIAMDSAFQPVDCQAPPLWTCSATTEAGRPAFRFTTPTPNDAETFIFTVHTPSTAGSFAFPTVQSYDDGHVSRWIGSGEPEPAPVLNTSAAAPAPTTAPAATPAAPAPAPTTAATAAPTATTSPTTRRGATTTVAPATTVAVTTTVPSTTTTTRARTTTTTDAVTKSAIGTTDDAGSGGGGIGPIIVIVVILLLLGSGGGALWFRYRGAPSSAGSEAGTPAP